MQVAPLIPDVAPDAPSVTPLPVAPKFRTWITSNAIGLNVTEVPPKHCCIGWHSTRPFRVTVVPNGATIAPSSNVTWTLDGAVTVAAVPTT